MSKHEVQEDSWDTGLCSCGCGSCLLGTICPCLIVGRTASRREDPSNEEPSMCNGDCAIHGILSMIGCGWIFTTVRRGDIRDQFSIKGNCCGDCCTAFWCPCCSVIQQDTEVKERLISKTVKDGYQPQGGMQVPHQG